MADAARFVAWGEVGAADMTDAPRGHFSETACSEFPDIVPLDTVDPYYNNQYYGRHYG
jgi:hypothetical protein